MARYIFKDGECIEVDRPDVPEAKVHVVPDIQPYKSMIDGHMVTSRSEHRRHLKDHGCIEIGNETQPVRAPEPISRDERRKLLHRQLGDMSDRQANKLMAELRRQAR